MYFNREEPPVLSVNKNLRRQHFIQSIAQQCIRSVGTHEQKGGDFILSTKADADYKNRAALGARMERFSCNSDLNLN